MTFHTSNYGSFGTSLPSDRNGFVTCSPRRVSACRSALESGRAIPVWTDRGANPAVARADIALEEWRSE